MGKVENSHGHTQKEASRSSIAMTASTPSPLRAIGEEHGPLATDLSRLADQKIEIHAEVRRHPRATLAGCRLPADVDDER